MKEALKNILYVAFGVFFFWLSRFLLNLTSHILRG